MPDAVIIKSRGTETLRLAHVRAKRPPKITEPCYLRLSMDSHNMPHSAAKVFIDQPRDFVEFFNALSSESESPGGRSWHSVERDLELSSTVKDGEIALSVTLASNWNADEHDDWTQQATFFLTPAQAAEVAASLREFWRI